jgi:hypothetical protein
MPEHAPLSTPLSHVLVAFTIELDNEFERRFAEAGGGARVASLTMWLNFLRVVGDGIAVGDLPAAAGLQKSRMLSTVGGMERWRYVLVDGPGTEKRDGYGSGRALRSEWVVRPTTVGEKAQAIWSSLLGEIEQRWEERFGADAVGELRGSLRAVVGRLDIALPEFMPILGSANALTADIPPADRRREAPDHLPGLLSQALLAYTLDFERESELSLALSENVVRVLDEHGVLVRDLPLRSGISKEAVAMASTALTKSDHATIEGATAATKVARLTTKGRDAQKRAPALHAEVEERFGADDARRLRAALESVLEQREQLTRGLEPPPGGWRASKPYLKHTTAVLEDPRSALPRYPMVLHRGGWPDGS